MKFYVYSMPTDFVCPVLPLPRYKGRQNGDKTENLEFLF